MKESLAKVIEEFNKELLSNKKLIGLIKVECNTFTIYQKLSLVETKMKYIFNDIDNVKVTVDSTDSSGEITLTIQVVKKQIYNHVGLEINYINWK